MEKKENKGVMIWVLVVLVLIALVVFFAINNKATNNEEVINDSTSMQNKEEGLQVSVLLEGTGPASKKGDNVSVKYTGLLTDGTVFDSNIDPKFKHVEPFSFTIGAGQVIEGWDKGVEGMKVGEKRKLVIQPELGYGANGAGKQIPPNAVLVFDIELISIN